MSRHELLAALSWQVDLGVDEAISDTPQDRFAESMPVSSATATGPNAKSAPVGATTAAPDAYPSDAAVDDTNPVAGAKTL
ncbi:MAG: hypothetical protein AAF317_08755, partial [Pseudomonadota bacterium]